MTENLHSCLVDRGWNQCINNIWSNGVLQGQEEIEFFSWVENRKIEKWCLSLLVTQKDHCPAIVQYAANTSAISRPNLDLIQTTGEPLKVIPLQPALEHKAATKFLEIVKFSASARVCLDTLVAFPFVLLLPQNVDLWVVSHARGREMLLKRPLLKIIGQDLDKVKMKIYCQSSEIDAATANRDAGHGKQNMSLC